MVSSVVTLVFIFRPNIWRIFAEPKFRPKPHIPQRVGARNIGFSHILKYSGAKDTEKSKNCAVIMNNLVFSVLFIIIMTSRGFKK